MSATAGGLEADDMDEDAFFSTLDLDAMAVSAGLCGWLVWIFVSG